MLPRRLPRVMRGLRRGRHLRPHHRLRGRGSTRARHPTRLLWLPPRRRCRSNPRSAVSMGVALGRMHRRRRRRRRRPTRRRAHLPRRPTNGCRRRRSDRRPRNGAWRLARVGSRRPPRRPCRR
ncbi:hypothetical protein BU14_2403s0001 [Porphyra umbilicalis]|uniref:Uncharacterized protein n=1 Tax=Porphyra umbilicalis TaxID=2786 RepID=A0A1X6NJM4_PORUM|nr:hypothetical protein BU14_2403s0001 [Porphyra umbilicalis]|eukprot:OSX68676.1 hypothetical protein BU14_2403s0001 [Porphyra umbilicalis]